jgi:hypothetical protein
MNENLAQETSAAHTEDTSGLEELQKAMDEINKLSNESNPEPDTTVEEKEELEQEKVVDSNEDNSEDITDIDQKEPAEIEETPDEEESEVISKPETKKQKEKKFWKERREKYKVLAERDKLAAELEELRAQRDKALEVGNYHYGQNAYSDLEKAKLLKKKAIEEGDIDALTEADIALVRAANAVDEVERWNSQSNTQSKTEDNVQNNKNTHNISLAQQEMVKDWLESHPELNPASGNYDTTFAQKVGNYINALDRNIADSGQSEHYFSDAYFEAIDNHIDSIRKPIVKTNTPPASADNVAGVKKSYQSHGSSQGRNTQKIILTADEKRMASNAGISEEDWLKYKIEELNKQKKRA